MKILLTADPELPVPPGLYGGIERIVEGLINGYVEKGHQVTLCANPASQVPCKLVPWKGLTSSKGADIIRNSLTLTRLAWSGARSAWAGRSMSPHGPPALPGDLAASRSTLHLGRTQGSKHFQCRKPAQLLDRLGRTREVLHTPLWPRGLRE